MKTCLLAFLSFFAIQISNAQDLSDCLSTRTFQQRTIIDGSGNNVAIVLIEFEDILNRDSLSGWEFRTNNLKQQGGGDFTTAYSGDGYLYYNGADKFMDGGVDIIEYKIRIEDPGTYRFVYASAIGIFSTEKNPSTEHNDAWVKFPDADVFFGYSSARNTIVIPNDENLNNSDPNDSTLKADYPEASYKFPEGSNERNIGFFKVYMNQLDDWWYEGSTSDSDAHEVLVRFDNPGIYTLQVSGRSAGFCLDRAVLWKEVGDYAGLNTRTKRRNSFIALSSTTPLCSHEVAPTITSSLSTSVTENISVAFYTATADEEVIFSLGKDKDEELFSLDTDALSFKSPPDFETPRDEDSNNEYLVDLIATDLDGNSSMQELVITVTEAIDQVLSDKAMLENGLMVYPNPVSELLKIESDEIMELVQLINVDGKVMSQESLTNSINVSDIANGNYLLIIKTHKGDYIKRLVIKH